MNYTIFILGPSGSGKTTFFASFFKKLALAGKNNFFLKTEDTGKQKYLVDLYERLANNGEWPPGTREFSSWTFDCYVQNSDQTNVKACGLNLFDYKGGVLTDHAESEDEEDFTQAAEDASAVLAILDGHKILAFMQDKDLMDKDVMRWMQKDLSNVLQTIQNFNTGKFPLHFIISKWDVLEDAGYSLKEIKHRLFEKVPELRNLVHRRDRAKSPAYLIPVSAVGQGFATLRDGIMEKNPGTIPFPSGVEIPLALTLTDLHKDVVCKQPVQVPNQKRTGSRLSLAVYFLMGLTMIAFLGIWGLLILGGYILFRLLSGSKNKTSRSNDNNVPTQEVLPEDAFHQLLDECRQIQEEFLVQFPEAICTQVEQGVKV